MLKSMYYINASTPSLTFLSLYFILSKHAKNVCVYVCMCVYVCVDKMNTEV